MRLLIGDDLVVVRIEIGTQTTGVDHTDIRRTVTERIVGRPQRGVTLHVPEGGFHTTVIAATGQITNLVGSAVERGIGVDGADLLLADLLGLGLGIVIDLLDGGVSLV